MTPPMRPARTLDVKGLLCPIPALEAAKAIRDLEVGELLEVVGDDPVMVIDIPAWCDEAGHELLSCDKDSRGVVRCLVEKRSAAASPG